MVEETDLFGIPIPSRDPVFIFIIIVHIGLGLLCVVSGLVAILTEKGKKKHSAAGKFYYWGMVFAFLTTILLSVMRWPHNIHLLSIGIFAFGFTYAGRRFAKFQPTNWTRWHTTCMGLSYTLLLTGFYVDNGKNLPFWNQFPQWFFWVFPSIVGIPIIIRVLLTHPLNKFR
jgi:hypothetical protein